MAKSKEVLLWLQSAKDDLAAAQAIVKQSAPVWVACFHCQQTAEKALKAAQIYYLKDFRKEHDLEVLLYSLKQYLRMDLISKEAEYLTDFYVVTRYPGIKEAELTLRDVERAIQSAQNILNFIDKNLK